MLDEKHPFEVDAGNLPHLMAESYPCLADAYDVYFGDPEYYVDESEGSADWLMVGPVPGGEILVVPIAESHHSGYAKVRPITILRAPPHIDRLYLDDKNKGECP
jgi:hypothetical protein